jgi:lipid A 3-O-deacylase
MMWRFFRAASFAAAVVCASAAARAPAMAADDPALFTIGAGLWDVNFNYKREFEGRMEYRHGQGLFETDSFRGLKPLIGVMATSAESVFGYAGFGAPITFGGGYWEFTPSAGLGAYSRGKGLDLGGTFEFHLGLAVSMAVTQNGRLGLYLTHISNAGINDNNPGVNSLLLTWSFAL